MGKFCVTAATWSGLIRVYVRKDKALRKVRSSLQELKQEQGKATMEKQVKGPEVVEHCKR